MSVTDAVAWSSTLLGLVAACMLFHQRREAGIVAIVFAIVALLLGVYALAMTYF